MAEGTTGGVIVPAGRLLEAARRRDMHDGSRWQWAALQYLLYGSECYMRLLEWLPEFHLDERRSQAAVIVQQQYRNRVARKIARARDHHDVKQSRSHQMTALRGRLHVREIIMMSSNQGLIR